MNITRYIGVDGCKAGWFFVKIDSDGKFDFGIMDYFRSYVDNKADNCLYLIDIPIGLPSVNKPFRRCDKEARRILSPFRHNSVFSPPCRETLETKDYDNACKINKAITGRKISWPAWGIGPKIREIDMYMKKHPRIRKQIREIHPEVCFWALAGGHPMKYNKRTEQGFSERMDLLGKFYPQSRNILKEALKRYLRRDLAKDDILDALAAAISGFLSKGKLITISKESECDVAGLPMEMVYFKAEFDPACLFCRWIKSDKALATFGTVAALKDGYPVTEGHLLIVPLRHTAAGFSMTEQEIRDSEALIRTLSEKISKNDHSVTGFNIGMNIGESAGQTVFHAHIHLIPRRGGDCDNPRGGIRGVIDGKRSY